MKLFKVLPVALFVASFAAALFPGAAQADSFDRLTKVTISAPVSIPAVHIKGFSILPAGTYVFRVLGLQVNRHVVQIFNEDQSKIIATIIAIPDYRMKPADGTVITFRERPAGQPPALRTWFFPGASWGEDFVYSKAQALEMAQANSAPVMFTSTEQQNDVESLPAVTAEAPPAQDQIMAYQPTGQEVASAEVAGTAPVEVAQDTTPAMAPPAPVASPEPATLPQTAGELPLIGLCGLLALGGGLLVRSLQNKVDDAIHQSSALRDEA